MTSNGLVSAVQWIEQLLVGPLATIIATLAVAILGFLLLEGRVDWGRGARTILGCFLIFGAPVIAIGLLEPATANAPAWTKPVTELEVPPPTPRPPEHYDPYAGAALPRNW
jgi:type IV secretion system protein VirB2